MIIKKNNTGQRLPKSEYAYRILARPTVALFAFFLFFTGMVSLILLLTIQQFELKNQSVPFNLEIKHWFDQAKQIGEVVSHHPMIKNYFIAHAEKQLTITDITKEHENILKQALVSTTYHTVLGITQLDSLGRKIAQVGMIIPEYYLYTESIVEDYRISGPFFLNEQYFFILSSPFFDSRLKKIGSNILAISLNGLEKLLIEKQWMLEKSTEAHIIFFKKNKINANELDIKFMFDPNQTIDKKLTRGVPVEKMNVDDLMEDFIIESRKESAENQVYCCIRDLVYTFNRLKPSQAYLLVITPFSNYYGSIFIKILLIFFVISAALAMSIIFLKKKVKILFPSKAELPPITKNK
jgi:hypothetical protein